MFKLNIKKSDGYCFQFRKNIKFYRQRIARLKQRLAERGIGSLVQTIKKQSDFMKQIPLFSDTCPAFDFEQISAKLARSKQKIKKCSIYAQKIDRNEIELYKRLRSLILQSNSDEPVLITLETIGKFLYGKSIDEIKENGFKRMAFAVNLLGQASCAGNHEASFMLSVIYAHGIGIKSDQVKVASSPLDQWSSY